ncbi:MAG: DNA repair protein RadC [Anaerolineales bacterium]|nr:DNA repair protein RadC [Anaerolineales bacterium]
MDDPEPETSLAPRITDLPAVDRPRERLAREGATALSSAELLAILLRVGIAGENAVRLADRLLAQLGGLPGLHRTSYTDLCRVKGIGPAKAAQLMAGIELGRRIISSTAVERVTISSPADAANLLMYQLAALDQEYLYVILLDTRNRVLGLPLEVYHGSLNTSLIRIGEVFREAVRVNAAAVIVAHNHPSGDPSPSPEDIAVTRAIVEAGKLLDIEVLDHLVIGRYRFVSLKERGLGFSGSKT